MKEEAVSMRFLSVVLALGGALLLWNAASAEPARVAAAADKPGVFDYYVLTLSWSPTFCAELEPGRTDPQCSVGGPRRYAFVLHGLWPQFEQGWPEFCETGSRAFVPRAVANRMLDIMPSDRLVFHQYRKHGTCSGLGVDGYFALSRKLYEKVKIPAPFQALDDPRFSISPADLKARFAAANPGLKPDHVAVTCGGAGDRMKEVRVCFDKSGAFRSCGRNETPQRQCRASRMYVPPVR
jgi:ribonuclease T2